MASNETHAYDVPDTPDSNDRPRDHESRNIGTATVDDLLPMTAEHFDVVTEVKPELTATITIPKENGSELAAAIRTEFNQLDWVRYVEIDGELDITPAGDELHVTGPFYLTAHLPPETVDATEDEAIEAIRTRARDTEFIQTVTDLSLRMPPYTTGEY